MTTSPASSSARALGETCNFIRGVSFEAGEAFQAPRPYTKPILRAGNIQEVIHYDSDLIWVPDIRVANVQRLRAGDILICMSSGSASVVGKTCHVSFDWDGSVGAFCGIIRPKEAQDSLYLSHWFRSSLFKDWRDTQARGANILNLRFSELAKVAVPWPTESERREIANKLSRQFELIAQAHRATQTQINEVDKLTHALLGESLNTGQTKPIPVRDCVHEITEGVGSDWQKYPILGATREGLAPAKEPAGKNPGRYKPVTPGTVFYNPMRILIGSIAFLDDDDQQGITSPDYVVLKGTSGVLDSRWFYYWLRSPLGKKFINSLARGAVRERMLFNRLAEGEIELPDFPVQEKASQALAQIKPMRAATEKQMQELELVQQKLLVQFFKN